MVDFRNWQFIFGMQAWFNLSKYNLIQIMVIFLQNEHVFLPDNYVSMGYRNMSSKLLSTVDNNFWAQSLITWDLVYVTCIRQNCTILYYHLIHKIKALSNKKGLQANLLPVCMCNFHSFCCPLHCLTYLGRVKKAVCKKNKNKVIIIVALALIFLFCMHSEEILLHQGGCLQ